MLKQRASIGGPFLKTTDIIEVVEEVLGMPSFVGMDKERILAELQTRFTVVTGEHQTLGTDDGHIAWLPSRRSAIAWRYWDRYSLYLEERLPHSAVNSVDKVTNDILERIEAPDRQGSWDRRGLVMGHVQSGKTANYCGLVCKAADAGYKVIIVLAGVHNSLRSQTQIRLEEGFLGFMNDTFGTVRQTFKPIGVGLMDSSIRANTGTSRVEKGDFNQTVASQFGIHPGGLPLLFVVKKHVGVLNNLIMWIRSCADAQEEATGRKFVRDVPALVIDDEADLASVDTKRQAFDEHGQPDEDHNPAKTNRNIRLLLRSFEKVAYVAYTATPFANIYIHDKGWTREVGDDLFPRSFIVNIPPPSNYMGPSRMFGIEEDEDAGLEKVTPLPVVRPVRDYAASEQIDETSGWMPPKLENRTAHTPKYQGHKVVPPSLREAIMCFLVAAAVRKLREPGPLFNSMLIHVVRYTKVQKRVTDQVTLCLKDIHQRLRNGDGDRAPTIAEEFEEIWKREFIPTTARCADILGQPQLALPAWSSVHPSLEDIVSGVRIKTINGSAGDILDYENHKATGMDMIAIGGDKLSRGLTLEGLSVSYFLRASRMYDTLMQMGRWFGYREQYIDVCRLYTTAELFEWFAHIATASEELQSEFDHMVNVGGTPRDYGLKVRSHPVMLVTSAVKMRHGTDMKLSFSGNISETTVFSRDPKRLQHNLEAAEGLVGTLGIARGTGRKGGYTWTTKAANVLDFLGRYKTHEEVRQVDSVQLLNYIKAQNEKNELLDWTVHLASSEQAESAPTIAGLTVGLITRAKHPQVQRADRYTIRRIVSPADESIDLAPDEFKAAKEATIANWQISTNPRKSKQPPTRPSGLEARQVRNASKGLLLLYPLDPDSAGLPKYPPVVGFALSFPKSETARELTYTVNNVYTERGGDDDSL